MTSHQVKRMRVEEEENYMKDILRSASAAKRMKVKEEENYMDRILRNDPAADSFLVILTAKA